MYGSADFSVRVCELDFDKRPRTGDPTHPQEDAEKSPKRTQDQNQPEMWVGWMIRSTRVAEEAMKAHSVPDWVELVSDEGTHGQAKWSAVRMTDGPKRSYFGPLMGKDVVAAP